VSTVNRRSTELARDLVSAWAAVGPALMKWMTATPKHSGVTWARMKTLHALDCHGPQIMSSLRDELGVTARSVTALVDALEADGMVRRVPHPSDRRATIIELTATGQRTIKGQFEAHAERAAQLFDRLDPADQHELLRLLRLLSTHLADLRRECP
jgi:DNA-binding MarR family transcriptional regulator